MNLPIMNLHERVLSVLGCRYVSDILIDAPYTITPEMISSLHISEVVHGSVSDEDFGSDDENERYHHAKAAGKYKRIESPSQFKLKNIVNRIHRNQEAFQAKFERKKKAENDFYNAKYGPSSSNGSNT
jgi:ethanolamine-phosphate cytidylyltransferase